MPSLIFDKCCGCIELKSGCLLIGYIQLVYAIIIFIITTYIIIAMQHVSAAAAAAIDMDVDLKHDIQTAGVALLAMCVIWLLIATVLLAFTITLLVGLHKRIRGHVKAYLIYAVIYLVLSVILFFISFTQSVSVYSIIFNLIGILLTLYFILVIRSYYYKMDNNANKGVVYNTA